jgi:hypothetical protein
VATLVNNKKYGEGHQVVLKAPDKIPLTSRSKFAAAGYTAGKSIFSIVTNINKVKISKVIELAPGKGVLYLKDDKNNVISIKGSDTSINGTFNHHSDNAKSNTNLLTEIKENISMLMFEAMIERNQILSEDEVISKLGKNATYYNTVYYESAVKQSKELKTYIKGGKKGYVYERQNVNLTKKIYDNARKLTKKANDNWNPADVWMIRRNYDIKQLYTTTSDVELNESILLAIKNQDIIPVSLKQVTNPSAKLSVVDPARLINQKIDLDFAIKSIALSETFNNFIIETKSGFAIRGGFKASASTLNVSLEGRFIGAGFQVGAVDAKAYKTYMQDTYGYTLRGGSQIASGDYDLALQEMEKMFAKFGKLSNKLNNYAAAKKAFEDADQLTKDRFANITSYLASFLLAPKNNKEIEENLKRCYFLSKKITDDSCAYVIIQ